MKIKQLRKLLESREAKEREDLLVNLANLGDGDCAWFWRRWPARAPGGAEPPTLIRRQADDAELLQIRDELRAVWDRAPVSTLILHEWLEWRAAEDWLPAFVPMPQMAYVRPNPINLRVQLVFAACAAAGKMAHCQADGCPAPYFLRYRDERQQFCDRPECLEFGQRLHKREWARKSRKQQKSKQTGTRKGK